MAGTVGSGSGGAMEYEYNPTDQHGPQTARPHRCPAMNGYSNNSITPFSYSGYNQRQGSSDLSVFTNYNLDRPSAFRNPPHYPQQSPFQFTLSDSRIRLPAPNVHLAAPTRPDESSAPASALYSSLGRPNFESSNVSGLPIQSSNPHPIPSDLGSTPLRPSELASNSSTASTQSDSSSSGSTQVAAPASQSEPIQQRPGQSSSGLPEPRVQLPPLPAAQNRRTQQALAGYAWYQGLSAANYEAMHAAVDSDSVRPRVDSESARLRRMNILAEGRESQLLRGRFDGKRVASKKAVQSLEKVDVASLEDGEKTCVICYNDFGVASPEGVVETPIRLPKCKHVFGDKCILQWLRESFNCPYCRDKLESELARPDPATIHRMLTAAERSYSSFRAGRISGRVDRSQTSSTSSDRLEARIETSGRARDPDVPTEATTTTRGERRAAPSEDANDAQRRQRPRFADPIPHTGTEDVYRSLGDQRTQAWAQNPQYTPQVPNQFSPLQSAQYYSRALSPHATPQLPSVFALPVHGPHYPSWPPDSRQSSTLADMHYLQMPIDDNGRFTGPLASIHSLAYPPITRPHLPPFGDRPWSMQPDTFQNGHSTMSYPGSSSSEQPRSPAFP